MNRRQFLQTLAIVPTSAVFVYFAEKTGSLAKCKNCLPLKLHSTVIRPTNSELLSFSARKTTILDYIRELWQKFSE